MVLVLAFKEKSRKTGFKVSTVFFFFGGVGGGGGVGVGCGV